MNSGGFTGHLSGIHLPVCPHHPPVQFVGIHTAVQTNRNHHPIGGVYESSYTLASFFRRSSGFV
jgi:hypothetical protein